jgi:peptide/nickel transport system substrate-binding protein
LARSGAVRFRFVSMRCFNNSLPSFLLLILLCSGCYPPHRVIDSSGKAIEKIDIKASQNTHLRYTTQVFPHSETPTLEALVSPYPLGQAGGTFYSSSIGSGPKTFNPMVSTDATSGEMAELMFVGLTSINAHTGEIQPYLAHHIQTASDQCTHTVTLRRGLQWSDGHPLTSSDVVFTWNRLVKAGLGNPSMRDIVSVNGVFPEIKALDERTIQFKTPKPFAPFLSSLSLSILPEHVIAPLLKRDSKAFDSFWGVQSDPKSFVVSGPFILERYLSGQRAIFTRNPRFFMRNKAGQTLPYLHRYQVDFVQDQSAEILRFEQGQTDSLGVPANQLHYVSHLRSPQFNLLDLGPTTTSSFLVFNLNPRHPKSGGPPYVRPVASAWFRDLNFRKAVSKALYRQEIIETVMAGIGEPLFTPESLTSRFLNTALAKGYPPNLEEARVLLRQSGFFWDHAGRLRDKNKNLVSFELNTNAGNAERENIGVLVKEDLNRLGIMVHFKTIDFNVLVGKIDTSLWESIILGLTGSTTEPNGGKNVFMSDGSLHLFNQRHADQAGIDQLEPWEKTLDRLFNQGATTLDFKQRKAIYDQYQQVVYDNLPFIYLYSGKRLIAVKKNLYNLDPTAYGLFHNLESLYKKGAFAP